MGRRGESERERESFCTSKMVTTGRGMQAPVSRCRPYRGCLFGMDPRQWMGHPGRGGVWLWWMSVLQGWQQDKASLTACVPALTQTPLAPHSHTHSRGGNAPFTRTHTKEASLDLTSVCSIHISVMTGRILTSLPLTNACLFVWLVLKEVSYVYSSVVRCLCVVSRKENRNQNKHQCKFFPSDLSFRQFM